MAWHTVREATQLTGRSRRSIFRDMAAGRITASLGRDGKRRIETSELIRAYGEIQLPDTPMAQEEAQLVTPQWANEIIAQVNNLTRVVNEQFREIQELKETLRIEHKPEAIKPSKSKSPATWNSLLAELED